MWHHLPHNVMIGSKYGCPTTERESQAEAVSPVITWLFTYLFLNFLFCIGVQLINNGVIFASEQCKDSAIHIHVSILPQPLPSRLPYNTVQSSMCYTVGPCWLSILNIARCS